jgi:hypothetical protein
MKKKLTTLTALFLSNLVLGLNFQAQQTLAQELKIEASIAEYKLNDLQTMPWGGDDFPYSKVTKIEDTLNPEVPKGYLVMDRHGIDESGFSKRDPILGRPITIREPFSEPAPGKQVYITVWGVTTQGCSADLIMQLAPKGSKFADKDYLIKEIVMGMGPGRILKLVPPAGSQPKTYRSNYNFSRITNGSVNQESESANFLISKTKLGIGKDEALLLMNAPKRVVKAKIVLAKGEIIVDIGPKTVERWKTIYSQNPACQNLEKK